MRLSTQQFFHNGLNDILDAQQRLNKLQGHISSGKKIDTPADDPMGAAHIISINQQLSASAQYQKNADDAESRLRIEETTLDRMDDTIRRVRELTLQAGDGSLGLTDRKVFANELRQHLEYLTNLANTQDSSGLYIFGGYQADVPPFVKSINGGFDYQGDEGQMFIKIADNVNVAVSDSGLGVFQNIDEPHDFNTTVNAANTGSASIVNHAVSKQRDFDNFWPEGATITFSVVGTETFYTVTDSSGDVLSGGTPYAPLNNIPYTSGDILDFEGMHIELAGIPDNGDTINVTSEPNNKLGMLDAVEKVINGLESLPAGANLNELISDSLLSMDRIQNNILETEVYVGARLNQIDDAVNAHESTDLISRKLLSDIEDLDYAEALSNLSQQSFLLEAVQQSFVKISNMSLFNFIR